jgi:hypothetical protein
MSPLSTTLFNHSHPLFYFRLLVSNITDITLSAISLSSPTTTLIPTVFLCLSIIFSIFELPLIFIIGKESLEFRHRAKLAYQKHSTAATGNNNNVLDTKTLRTLIKTEFLHDHIHLPSNRFLPWKLVDKNYSLNQFTSFRKFHRTRTILCWYLMELLSAWFGYHASLMQFEPSNPSANAPSIALGVVSVSTIWFLIVELQEFFIDGFIPTTKCVEFFIVSTSWTFLLVILGFLLGIWATIIVIENTGTYEKNNVGLIPADEVPGFFAGIGEIGFILIMMSSFIIWLHSLRCCLLVRVKKSQEDWVVDEEDDNPGGLAIVNYLQDQVHNKMDNVVMKIKDKTPKSNEFVSMFSSSKRDFLGEVEKKKNQWKDLIKGGGGGGKNNGTGSSTNGVVEDSENNNDNNNNV